MPKRYVIPTLALICVFGLLPAISAYAQTKSSAPSIVVSPLSVGAMAKIEDPRFNFDIVLAKDAIPSEVYAAEELRKFFTQASGVKLPVVTQVDRPGRHIFIGPSEAHV
jgi:hypothetical protein